MKQQTAVEFLKQEYIKRGECLPSGVFQEALEMEKQQTEISDEEIEIAAKEYDIKSTRWGAKTIFIDAVKWYREQLKK